MSITSASDLPNYHIENQTEKESALRGVTLQ